MENPSFFDTHFLVLNAKSYMFYSPPRSLAARRGLLNHIEPDALVEDAPEQQPEQDNNHPEDVRHTPPEHIAVPVRSPRFVLILVPAIRKRSINRRHVYTQTDSTLHQKAHYTRHVLVIILLSCRRVILPYLLRPILVPII